MTFPGTRQQRALYIDAKRVRDEVGKGQEVLRQLGPTKVTQNAASTVYALVGIPDVPIKIVGVKVIGEGLANVVALNLLVLGLDTADTYDEAPAAANRLITELVASADNTIVYGVLTALCNSVPAEHPIMLLAEANGAATGTLEVVVSYILGDDERTFSIEV